MSERNDAAGNIALAVTLTAASLAAGFAIVAVNLGVAFAIPVGIVGLVAGAVIFRGPLGHALARRLEGGAAPSADPEGTVQALDEIRGRMAELEERVDFAERLLAQSREPDRLPE